MEKYQRTDITGVERENERDENYKGQNPQIDSTETEYNYHTVKRNESYVEYINQRIEKLNLSTKVRKDAVLMASFVIGSDREFFKRLDWGEDIEFFKDCTEYFAKHYGLENIISAVVHVDETTPHLHLNLIPITNGRLCCKDLFNRKALQELQTGLYEEVGKKWGLERGKEGSQARHLAVAEYKVKMAEEKAAEITTAYSETNSELTRLKAEKRVAQTEIESLTTQRESLSQEIDDLTEVKLSADAPIPLFGKDKIISSLRVENAQLKQEIERTRKDQAFMFTELQKAERTAASRKQAHTEVTEIKSVLPREYEELLQRARAAKKAMSHKSPVKFNGYSK